MSYNISAIVILKDQFSMVSARIAQSANMLASKFKEMDLSLKTLSRSAVNFGKMSTLFASLPIVYGFYSMTKAASDAQETISKFNTIFKDIRGEADLVADNFGRNFGIAGSKAKELLGNTADLLTGFGFNQKSSLELSKTLNELAVDLASFKNFSGGAAGASHALTSALLGEREAIKSLGISIQEEDVKKKIAQLRSEGVTFSSLRQAQAIATLKLALERSKNAIGDFARTSGGLANQMRILDADWLSLKEKLGQFLIPLALKLVDVLIKMINRFMDLSPAAQKIILAITGIIAVGGPLLLMLGAIGIALSGIGVALTVITSPITLTVLAIAAVIASLVYLYYKFKLVQVAVDFFAKGLLFPFKLLYVVIETLLSKLSTVADFFKNVFGTISSFFGGNVPDINMSLNTKAIGPESNQSLIRNFNFNPTPVSSQNTLNGRLDIGISAPPSIVQRTQLSMTDMPPNLGYNLAY